MIFNRLVRICGLAIILICYLLISCGPLPEEQTVTSISPTTATASDTQAPTVVPTPYRSLPEEILMAIKNGVQSSDDFSSQLDNDWYFSAEYVKREGENVHVYGGGNWEGYILNTEAVRSGEAVLASFQVTDDTSAEIGLRVGTQAILGDVGFDEKTTFGVYLNPGGLNSSLWDNSTYIDNAEGVELEGMLNLVQDHSYLFFGAVGDSSGIVVIWDQDDPSSYALYSPEFLDRWNYPGWYYFVNTNHGSVIMENYEEWLIDFNTAGIDKFVSTSPAIPPSNGAVTAASTPIPVPNSSYESSITSIYVDTGGNLAVGYADFNQDGLEDMLAAYISGGIRKSPIKMVLQNPSGSFDDEVSLLPDPLPGTVHARKIIIADFNSDTIPDAFIADHGYDKPPFPGAEPLLLLSTDDGFEVGEIPNIPTGFQHSATAADITGDGSPDIFVTDTNNGSFLLLNDGAGHFALTREGLPKIHRGYYSSELIDLDDDGFYDLIVGGHEHEGATTRVYWGDAAGTFSTSSSTYVPDDGEYRITLDFDAEDLDGDGTRELLITRTKSNPFYQGYYFQMLDINEREITDVSNRIVPDRATWEGSTADWVPWVILRDFNDDGHLDIVVPDRGCAMVYLNDGSGDFAREP